jgi:small subunit ribosomal protein S1
MTTQIDLDKEIDQVLVAKTSKAKDKKAVTENSSPMAQLLKDNPIKVPKEGEKVKGKVIQIDNNAVYVDLLELGTGVVYGKEVKDGFVGRGKLQIDDEVTAIIVDLENEDGYVELSVREAARDEAWDDLLKKKESRDIVAAKILDANKGGLMIQLNGIIGFMPVSQLTAEHYPRVEDGDKNKILEILRSYVGTEMQICVIDAVKEEDKLIVSEKEAYKDKEKRSISELKIGDVIEGEISGVVDFGAFVKFFPPSKETSEREEDKLEGLVHISQLDWQLIENPRDVVKVGDKVQAKIIAIDDTRISLSIRELKVDPWSKAAEKYKVGDIVVGKVHKINHFGAFVYLDTDIHGLAHISEFLSKYPRKNIEDVIQIGVDYSWQIMSLEAREHRMGLKLADKKVKLKDDAKEEQIEPENAGDAEDAKEEVE